MEATAVSVGKAVLDGALGYAKSKAAEEVALQLGVERDVKFIRDELQMMQSFLMMADEEQSQNKVLMTWAKQIGVLAYKVEDSLMDFGLHSEKKPFLGCIPRNPGDRRRIAKELKQLKAEVEDVSNRNLRYRLIKESSGSKPIVAEEQASIAAAAMFATVEHDSSSKVNLHQLVTSDDVNLRVISMWGSSCDLGKTSAIQKVYDDPMVLKRFEFRAWIRLMHPFNPQEFLRSLVRQFYENSHDEVGKAEQATSVGANVLVKMETMNQSDLVCVFNAVLCSNSYLIVIDDLSTIVEWHCIKKYFPDNEKQSRIIVSTQQAEIASLCTEQPYRVSEFKQLSCDQTIYLFHKDSDEQVSMGTVSVAMFDTDEASFGAVENQKLKDMHASCSAEPISDSKKVTTSEKNITMLTSEIHEEEGQEPNDAGEEKVHNSTARKKFDRSRTLALADEVICGREFEKTTLINLVGQPEKNQDFKVISVWGMGGLGKTTLVRSIYRSQQLGGWKRAWATALRPFNREVLLRDLALQLQNTIQEDPAAATATEAQKKSITAMNLQELKQELARVLNVKNCLIVLDDISTTFEWELVKPYLEKAGRIIVTTREKNIAKHCSRENKNMYCLERLKHDAALDLFIKKAREENLVLTLEEGCCLSDTQGAIRHLVIGSNWKRDKDVLESKLDLSHVRSLTVFGEWRSFFISDNMRFLRVLDLEDTLELKDHHLDDIGQLLHLKYLSLRRCWNILYLPNSLRNLRHLEMLDVRGTRIYQLPTTITSLLKLQHLRADTYYCNDGFVKGEGDIVNKYEHYTKHLSTGRIYGICKLKALFLRPQVLDAGLNRYDIFNLYRFQEMTLNGVILPKGIGKLKALHTLGVVDVSGRNGNATIEEFGELTELRKLKVGGVNYRNINELWSAIAGHNQLQSLSVDDRSGNTESDWIKEIELDGCLGEDLLPPSSLESLTLHGKLVNVTQWIHKLQNLTKLVLKWSRLEQDDAIQALGVLPNIAVLCLGSNSFRGTELHFQRSSFPSLLVLDLNWLSNLQSVLFDKGTMPRLELLQVDECVLLGAFRRLRALKSLKEIRLGTSGVRKELKKSVERQVAKHMKHVRVVNTKV